MIKERVWRTEKAWLLWIVLGLMGVALGLFAVSVKPLYLIAALAVLGIVALLVRGWPMSGILLLMASTMVSRYSVTVAGRKLRVEQAAVALVVILLFTQIASGRSGLIITWPGLLILGWWSWIFASSYISPLGFLNSLDNLVRSGLMIAIYLTVVNVLRSWERLRGAFRALLIISTLEAAYGLVALLIYVLTDINIGVQINKNWPIPVPYGTLFEGNIFGSHCMSIAVICLTFVFARQEIPLRTRPRLTSVCLAINILAMILSMSRGAWLAFACAGSLAFVLIGKRMKGILQRVVVATFIMVAILFIMILIINALPADIALVGRLRSLANLPAERTVIGRMNTFEMAISSWRERPWVGWGGGSMEPLHGLKRPQLGWVSNLVIRLLLDNGIIGLGLFALFVVVLLWRAWRASKRSQIGILRTMLVSLIASYVGLLIAYQATDAMLLGLPWIHVGLIASATGLANGYGMDVNDEKDVGDRLGRSHL